MYASDSRRDGLKKIVVEAQAAFLGVSFFSWSTFFPSEQEHDKALEPIYNQQGDVFA